MSSDTILSSSLTGKNECELCGKLYTSKDLHILFMEGKHSNVIFVQQDCEKR